MSAPRLFHEVKISAEVSNGDYHGVAVELALGQTEGLSLTLKHYGDVADGLTTPEFTVFGVLAAPGVDDPARECGREAYVKPAVFLKFVAAMNALAARLPDMIAAAQYTRDP